MASATALKYARALADVAFESGRQERASQELAALASLLKSHAELRKALENPVIPFSAKRRIMEQLAPRLPLSDMMLNFTLIILENARIQQLQDIAAAFQEVLDERRGVVRGRVRSARQLDQPVRTRLASAMSAHLGKTVHLSFEKDESLIGGLKLQVGSMIFDASIRTQLEVIEKRLAGQ